MKKNPVFRSQTITHPSTPLADNSVPLLCGLGARLRESRTPLGQQRARRSTDARVLTAMTKEEICSEATSAYDNAIAVLETEAIEAFPAYARNLSERIPRGVETHVVVGMVPQIRDVPARWLHKKYPGDFGMTKASVIITGSSAKIAQTLVTIGVDLTTTKAGGDLQDGIEEAGLPLGYTVIVAANGPERSMFGTALESLAHLDSKTTRHAVD